VERAVVGLSELSLTRGILTHTTMHTRSGVVVSVNINSKMIGTARKVIVCRVQRAV
jgi:hypothetical protein